MTRDRISADIQGQVVAMYESHPFPSYADKFRKTAEEMHLKMRLLGIPEEEYKDRQILDCGCGTGEFSCWYAAQGNQVTAVDLSAPSLENAKAYAEQYDLSDRVDFVRMSVLDLDFPDDTFDLVYSYGVLHHTPDPLRGLENMVRVCKPGGIVVVSVYSRYSRFIHRQKQRLINRIAGDDIEKRFKWGKRLFPLTARKLKLRAHDASDAILYDQFSIPHESLHTVDEVLGWLDKHELEYLGAFGPLRIRDYLYAASIPEYERLETTFQGYPLTRVASGGLKGMSRLLGFRPQEDRKFQRPSRVSRLMVQMGWFLFGLRFSCFSIAGRKPTRED
ncbi:MAG: class I SAM-dependent methyltransferase [Thermoanaerobaculia bacterium]